MKYIPTIGLEIHAELKTQTKMFCDSANDPAEQHPNVNICPVCMGHPGTLPVINKQAVEFMIRVGYALHCTVADIAKFDRKNYFYPDLPKGYQISQYDMPFCQEGYIDLANGKRIRVQRVHLEEDTGRLQHTSDGKHSLVDFNRAGVPLMELVTHPDIHNAEEAREFAEELQLILRYLGASDAEMERGQMRVEVNLSLAPEGAEKLGTKVEVKNLNSFRTVERAVAYEIERQTQVLDSGEKVVQETRGFDDAKQITFSQREKEEAHDYRYFPEPDLPLVYVAKEYGLDKDLLESSIPELPQAKRKRLKEQYKLDDSIADIFIRDKMFAEYFENVISEVDAWEESNGHDNEPQEVRTHLYSLATNYLVNDLRALMQQDANVITDIKITPEDFAEFISLLHQNVVSSRGAKDVLQKMYEIGDNPTDIVKQSGLAQMSNANELEEIVAKVIEANEGPVADYKKGKETALQFLVGQIMRETKGKANPQLVAEILKEKLV
ncbi:MAG: Asp-tRNA(Asn)/Glu-tRNA(Gln) amidotransferase subunit GatB [Candidatus Spechtbacteria bacterium]|nr:Asp-tRNA(Asn)/Glu-tRNA(Gln) amidotransferase subunit GatB [Candidatus Spechtbacteria bacterium]